MIITIFKLLYIKVRTLNFDIEKILSTIENDIIPKTRASVLKGNKIFGGAILNKSDCSLVLADTNHELENPICGEMYVLKKFYEQKNYPPTKDLIFLSTHEPCSMSIYLQLPGLDLIFLFICLVIKKAESFAFT